MISAFYSWSILPRILGLPRTPHDLSSISWTTAVCWWVCHSHPDRGVCSSSSIVPAPCVCFHTILTWTWQPPKWFCPFSFIVLDNCLWGERISLFVKAVQSSKLLFKRARYFTIKGPVEQPICESTARLCYQYKRAFAERLWRASSLEYAEVRVSASPRRMLY